MSIRSFSICSFGRSGSTLISRILADDARLLAINELIEPLGENKFLSKNECNYSEFWDQINQHRPSFIQELWKGEITKEVLSSDKDSLSKVMTAYCLPAISAEPQILHNELAKFFSNNINTSTYRGLFIQFCKILLSKKKTASVFFERTGGGAHFINEIGEIFNHNVILNIRNLDATILSKSNHRVCQQFAWNYGLPSHLQEYKSNLQELDIRYTYEKVIRMMIDWYRKVIAYFESRNCKGIVIEYERLCSNPARTLKSLYEFIELDYTEFIKQVNIDSYKISISEYTIDEVTNLHQCKEYAKVQELDTYLRSLFKISL